MISRREQPGNNVQNSGEYTLGCFCEVHDHWGGLEVD
jgi:hypothetical protein